jgi:hypothetical protein
VTSLQSIHQRPDNRFQFTLEPGDVLLTGTPAVVGRIVPGYRLAAEIPGVATLRASVATSGISLFPLTWYGDSC